MGCSRLDQHVIHVAVAPVFSGLEGADDRVSRVVEVLGRVVSDISAFCRGLDVGALTSPLMGGCRMLV